MLQTDNDFPLKKPKADPSYFRNRKKKLFGIKLPEAAFQKNVEQLIGLRHPAYFHIPDNLYKFLYSPYLAQTLERHSRPLYGMLRGLQKSMSDNFKGYPDLTLIEKVGDFSVVDLWELKTRSGQVRQGQKTFAKRANVAVIRKMEQATERLKEFENFVENLRDICK